MRFHESKVPSGILRSGSRPASRDAVGGPLVRRIANGVYRRNVVDRKTCHRGGR